MNSPFFFLRLARAFSSPMAAAALLLMMLPASLGLAKPVQSRLDTLTKGINLSHWFWDTYAETPGDPTWITQLDYNKLKRLGVRHVRIPVDPVLIYTPSRPTRLKKVGIARLDAAIDLALANGFGVVLDIHSTDAKFRAGLESKIKSRARFAQFWGALAARYANRDPEKLFFEILNEPNFDDKAAWASVRDQALAAIRAAAPSHTVIVGTYQFQSYTEFDDDALVADQNVAYALHFYEPFVFTHQGARLEGPPASLFAGLPYPSSPLLIAGLLNGFPASVRDAALTYGTEQWNLARMRGILLGVKTWADVSNVAVICNEFGVRRPSAPRQSRLNWHADAVASFSDFGIGWCMYEYFNEFGLVARGWTTNERTIDIGLAEVLGFDISQFN